MCDSGSVMMYFVTSDRPIGHEGETEVATDYWEDISDLLMDAVENYGAEGVTLTIKRRQVPADELADDESE